MKTLNKDEVRKLAPELQKVVGTVEVQRVRTRRRLVERARGYNGMSVITGLWMGAAMGLAIYSVVNPRVLLLLFAIVAVTALVGFHAAGLNRRLVALMRLVEHDINKDSTREQEGDDDAA
jgi:hypothetical protein